MAQQRPAAGGLGEVTKALIGNQYPKMPVTLPSIPANAARKGSGESIKVSQAQKEQLADKISQTSMRAIDPDESEVLKYLQSELMPGIATQRKDVKHTRDLLGFLGKTFNDNRQMLVDFRPLGHMLENMYPEQARGLSKIGAPSPYIDKAIDMGKTLLAAENNLSNQEIKALDTLLANKYTTGRNFTSGLTQSIAGGRTDPSIQANSLGERKFAAWLSENSKKRKERIGKSFDNLLPIVTAARRTGNLFEKYARYDPKRGGWVGPGADSPILRLGGSGLISLLKGPAEAEFYQSALNMAQLKLKLRSGAQATNSEFEKTKDTMGQNWKSSPALVVSGYDADIDEIIDFIRGKKSAQDGPEILEYLRDTGITIEKLEAMKIANRMLQVPKRTEQPAFENPGVSQNEVTKNSDGSLSIDPAGKKGTSSNGVMNESDAKLILELKKEREQNKLKGE